MRRRGVVLVSEDSGAAAFVQDIVEQHAPEESSAIELGSGKKCIAVVNGSRRRRLVIIDGEPSDLSAGALIEGIRLVDSMIRILLVRTDRDRGSVSPSAMGGVHVVAGPFVSLAVERCLVDLLQWDPREAEPQSP
jgi:hypothetical protein